VSFASPAFLVGLALIPVLVVLYARAERRPQSFAPAKLLPSVVPARPGWRRHASIAGYAVALAVLLVALAKPQATVAVPTEQARVMIVTDHSGSMQATDVAPNRLAAAKKAAGTFLDALPGQVRVGAIAFNQKADVLQSPTRDHDAVREALQAVRPAGTTATGDAIKTALATITGKAPAAIVLLSDGKSTKGVAPLTAAQEAGRKHIPIYTVALGTAGGTITVPRQGGGTETRQVPPDPATMRQIASASGGQAFAAADEQRLSQVYERLGSQLGRKNEPREISSMFAAAALAFVLAGAALTLRWFGRLI